jgi:hypothetical protein
MYEANYDCTNHDVVLLLSSSQLYKLCENLENEDNFNNTFSLKSFRTTAVAHRIDANLANHFKTQSICKNFLLITFRFSDKNSALVPIQKWTLL